MSEPLAVLFLTTSHTTRAALAGALLRRRIADTQGPGVQVEAMCLDDVPVQTPPTLLSGIDLPWRPLKGLEAWVPGNFDLVISLDEAARHAMVERLADSGPVVPGSGDAPRLPGGALQMHWPGPEPEDIDGARSMLLSLQSAVDDLVRRGTLQMLAARRRRRRGPVGQDATPATPAPALASKPQPAQQVFHGMIGCSPAMQRLFRSICKAAAADYPVLIQGETGTGKELAAQAIHQEGPRRDKPFVAVNCGTLPEHLAESELFGHVRGAFTGALKSRRGRFELADAGTIFLDEVGELAPSMQVKLLRVLQERCFEPVGSEESLSVDVRIIAATHRDLRAGVEEGWFREDLYYRLCVLPVLVPPLRARKEDILPIARHQLGEIHRATGRSFLDLPPEIAQRMMDYDWPGNVRELINVVQRAAVNSSGNELTLHAFGPELLHPGGRTPAPALIRPGPATRRRAPLDVDSVRRALAEAGGNRARAARILGVARSTLYEFLDRSNVE